MILWLMIRPSPVPEPPFVVKKGTKHMSLSLRRNPAPIIGNLNEKKLPVTTCANINATRCHLPRKSRYL